MGRTKILVSPTCTLADRKIISIQKYNRVVINTIIFVKSHVHHKNTINK